MEWANVSVDSLQSCCRAGGAFGASQQAQVISLSQIFEQVLDTVGLLLRGYYSCTFKFGDFEQVFKAWTELDLQLSNFSAVWLQLHGYFVCVCVCVPLKWFKLWSTLFKCKAFVEYGTFFCSSGFAMDSLFISTCHYDKYVLLYSWIECMCGLKNIKKSIFIQ